MCVFDGLFILLLVFNTDDTYIKLKNRLIHFTCSNSTTVNVGAYTSISPRSALAIRHLNSTIKILYAIVICPVRVPRRPPPQTPNYSPRFDDQNDIL